MTDEEREAALQQRERVAAVRIPLEVEPFAVDVNRVHIGAALVGFVWFVRPVWVFAVRIPLKREPAAVVIQ